MPALLMRKIAKRPERNNKGFNLPREKARKEAEEFMKRFLGKNYQKKKQEPSQKVTVQNDTKTKANVRHRYRRLSRKERMMKLDDPFHPKPQYRKTRGKIPGKESAFSSVSNPNMKEITFRL